MRVGRAGDLSYYVATVFEPLRSTPAAVRYDRGGGHRGGRRWGGGGLGELAPLARAASR